MRQGLRRGVRQCGAQSGQPVLQGEEARQDLSEDTRHPHSGEESLAQVQGRAHREYREYPAEWGHPHFLKRRRHFPE